MKTHDFDYILPDRLIAHTPADIRHNSKFLISQTTGIEDCFFHELPNILNDIFKPNVNGKKILLLANNSRVYPARVRIRRKTGARGEVFFLETGERETYHCLLRPKSKLKLNEVLFSDCANETPLFQVVDLEGSRVRILNQKSFESVLEQFGEMPLPPYIERASVSPEDKDRYQTIYSEKQQTGSCASPTAGLHFTSSVMEGCQKANVEFAYVTLHVGLGTFAPVQSEHPDGHQMHEEFYLMTKQTTKKIFEYIANDWPIIFVGTTSLRATESFLRSFCKDGKQTLLNEAVREEMLLQSDNWLKTDLFLYPKHSEDRIQPLVGQGIITNFHQQQTTLVMLIAGLVGYKRWKQIYTHAVQNKYRFFSYGDSSLLIF